MPCLACRRCPVLLSFSICRGAGSARRTRRSVSRTYERTLSERERNVVELVNAMRFATSRHIQIMLFHGLSSDTQCDRTLQRLARDGYLSRIRQWPSGGSAGGSFRYVYRLGQRGSTVVLARLNPSSRRTVEHCLAVADCAVILTELERQGLQVVGFDFEPDCHLRLGRAELKPDLYAHIVHGRIGTLKLWLEVDMDTQGTAAIMRKLRNYVVGYKTATDAELERLEPLPRVLFVAVDAARQAKLRLLIQDLPEADRQYFRVTTREELPHILMN